MNKIASNLNSIIAGSAGFSLSGSQFVTTAYKCEAKKQASLKSTIQQNPPLRHGCEWYELEQSSVLPPYTGSTRHTAHVATPCRQHWELLLET